MKDIVDSATAICQFGFQFNSFEGAQMNFMSNNNTLKTKDTLTVIPNNGKKIYKINCEHHLGWLESNVCKRPLFMQNVSLVVDGFFFNGGGGGILH